MKLAISSKRVQIDKSNTTVVAVAAVAAALTIFSLVASKSLLDQRSFQSRVIDKKSVALKQLEENVAETTSLVASYQGFVSNQENTLGGNRDGEGPRDGDNAKIVLDALPSKYDFPALVTSIEKMLMSANNVIVTSIGGTDEELAQSENQETIDPESIPVSFSFEVQGNYDSVQEVVRNLQKSIRPISVNSVGLSGSNDALVLEVNATTFYKPEKIIDIKTETVR